MKEHDAGVCAAEKSADQPSDALLRDNASVMYAALLAQAEADEAFELMGRTPLNAMETIEAAINAKARAVMLRDIALKRVQGVRE